MPRHVFAAPAVLLVISGCTMPIAETELTEEPDWVTAGTSYTLKLPQLTNSCMDVAAAGIANGTKIQEWACNGTVAQVFRVDKASTSGYFRLFNPNSGKCVDVTGNATADGTQIELWNCNNSGAQDFRFEASNGFNRMVGRTSGKCIDVNGRGTANGTKVQLWTCNGTPAQTWSAVAVGSGGATTGGTTGGGGGGTTKLDVKAGSVPSQYLPWLRQAAGMCAFIDAPHLAAQIEQESNWNPNAVSSIGAQGISQFLPGTWAAFGIDANGDGRKDPFDPADAIVSQGNYMCYVVGQLGSILSWTTVLWAYNQGPEATKRSFPNPPNDEAKTYADRILNQLLSKYVP